MRILFSILVLTILACGLNACNTIHGMGEDISAGGHAISHAAN